MAHIHTIVTHHQPHPDELVAIFLLQKLGDDLFGGISEAEVKILRPDDRYFAGRTPEQMEADGILMIGVGGGRFDEHAVGDKPRTDGHSAASLVGEALGCADDPIYHRLIEYATYNDLEGHGGDFEWGMMLKSMYASFRHAPLMVWQWAEVFMEAHTQQQEAFHVEAKQHLAERAKIARLKMGKTQLKIVSIQSDSKRVKSRAFSAEGGHNAVVVQRDHTGHIQVFTNGHFQLDLTRVVEEVRKAELTRRGGVPDPTVDYAAEGTMDQVPAWHYFLKGNMLLNGSLTAPDVTPSWMSLEEVTDLVIAHVRKQSSKKTAELATSGAGRA